ncbi:MAG: sigma-E factor negative regulatory protein RseA [Pseudohongiellaceae bacterium]
MVLFSSKDKTTNNLRLFMNELERESLSALLDGETDELELRRILQKSETDSSLLETWERYNLVHSMLTAEAVPVSSGFASGVADKLANEPLLSLTANSSTAGTSNSLKAGTSDSSNVVTWRQNISKLAIAASVALVFVFGFQTANQPNSPSIAGSDSAAFSAPASSPDATQESGFVLAGTRKVEPDPMALQRLTDYLSSAMTTKQDEPVRIEHIQDSPLYRLVNNLQAKP